jgi:protein SCO1/2
MLAMKNYNRLFLIGWVVMVLLEVCKSPVKKEAVTLPFYNTPDFTPHWIITGDVDYKNIHTIAPFTFTNQLGQTVSNQNVAGKIYVANFFFTSCQSICPGMMSNLAKVQQTFANDAQVMVLSHSVTPLRDNVATLAKYATEHHIDSKNWWLLTGDKDKIYTLARQSYFAENDNGFNKKTGDFLHTENLILVDKRGRIRGVYNGSLMLEVNNLIDHIRLLEHEN